MKEGVHLKRATERPMRIQSFTTPAMFIVRAEVLPMRRKTAKLRPVASREEGGGGGRDSQQGE